jgi:nickel-dependent lactate racemase
MPVPNAFSNNVRFPNLPSPPLAKSPNPLLRGDKGGLLRRFEVFQKVFLTHSRLLRYKSLPASFERPFIMDTPFSDDAESIMRARLLCGEKTLDLKILTGLIEPHFYAGYSGGCKAILPGISSFETMKFMHSYKMIDHPKVTNCLLEGNPFHEYGIRVTESVGADFILNAVINREREVAGVFAGHYNYAHLAGCDLVYRQAAVTLDHRFDMVITSGGGYPLDATFYQISKALICAMDILKKGGTIVVTCECREGLGSPEFCGIVRSVCSPKEFSNGYRNPGNFVIDQWCAQNIYQVLDYAGEVYIHSAGLSHGDIQKMGGIKIDDVQATVKRLLQSHPVTAVVPDGPYVVGMVT